MILSDRDPGHRGRAHRHVRHGARASCIINFSQLLAFDVETFILAVMPCPFLTRLPSNFVKNYASPLMKQYVEQCPFLGNNRGIVSSVLSTSATASDNTSLQDKCPFLKKVKSPAIIKKVAPQTKEDIIEDTRKYILTTNIFTKEVCR